jgi:hypothetical protein
MSELSHRGITALGAGDKAQAQKNFTLTRIASMFFIPPVAGPTAQALFAGVR